MKKSLVILAAGMGSRFGGLKQITPVGPSGEFIIDYSVYDAIKAGFDKVIFVIRKEHLNLFEESIFKRIKGIDVEYVFQDVNDIPKKKYLAEKREKPWGTVQAVLASKAKNDSNFVMINADDFYGRDSFIKAGKFLDENTDDKTYALISYPFNKVDSKYGAVKRGVITLDGDNITNIIESSIEITDGKAVCNPLDGSKEFKVEENHPVSMNFIAFKNNFYDYLEEYFDKFFDMNDEDILKSEALLPDVLKDKLLNKEVTLKNYVSTSTWLGMTYRDDLKYVQEEIQKLVDAGEYPSNLWSLTIKSQ